MGIDTIDFKDLSLRDALDLAILVEEEAKERYEELASQMGLHHTPEATSFFRTMIDNEAKHGGRRRVDRSLVERRAVSTRDALTGAGDASGA